MARPAGLMLGYADESGTPAPLTGRYYHTGDLARRDDRGCFHLLGRADDMFKSYDVRVSPLEVERTLQFHLLVAEVGVFAIVDEYGEPVPAAACVAIDRTQADLLPTILLDWQSDQLSTRHRVVQVWVVDALPKTLSGKISRAALRRQFARTTAPYPLNQVS